MQKPALITNVTIDPPAEQWGALLAKRRVDERSKRFREQMGLPTDRPIVMSGHQAAFWHSGIIAKYFAVQAACSEFGTAGAWIVVDQDDNIDMSVSYCIVDEKGRARNAFENLFTDINPSGHRGVPALPSIEKGLEDIRRVMRVYASEDSYHRRISMAGRDLIYEVSPEPSLHLLYATRLFNTDVFGWMLERMERDPAACVHAYNRAVDRYPESGMARLRVSEDAVAEYELPLWFLEPKGYLPLPTRQRVTNKNLPTMARHQLAPRALLMTALLRLAGCDLFIHGSGGASYDRVTDEWIGEWLGETLAPTTMVTATMLLPLIPDVGAAVAATRAVWLSHRAQHDPAVLGDEAAAKTKQQLLTQIGAAKSRGENPHLPYLELHSLLDSMRSTHRDKLEELNRAASEARLSASLTGLATDRTWPFPLFQKEDLQRLAAEVRNHFRS